MKNIMMMAFLVALPLSASDEKPLAPSTSLAAAGAVIVAQQASRNADGETVLHKSTTLRGVAPDQVILSLELSSRSGLKKGSGYILFLAGRDEHHRDGPVMDLPFVGAAVFADEPQTRALLLSAAGQTIAPGQLNKALNAALSSSDVQLQRFAALELMHRDLPQEIEIDTLVNIYASRDQVARAFLLHVGASNRDRFPNDWFLKQARSELNNGGGSAAILLENALDLLGFFGNHGDMVLLEAYLNHEHAGVFAAAWGSLQTRDRQRAVEIARERLGRDDLKEHQRRAFEVQR